MPPAADQPNTFENEFRIVVDAQIVLAMFLTRRDRSKAASPKRQLLNLLAQPTFRWLWSPDAVCDRLPSKKWGTGSITLLGDAIHPTTPNLGQGGCLAIEDAAVLARCLRKYASDTGPPESGKQHSPISVALRKFERLRLARTTAIARYSRIYGTVGQWESRWAAHLRTIVLSVVPTGLTKRLLAGIFDYDAHAVRL